ncbi:MAG: ATP-binding cassette domain-containing protein [Sphaerochaetaceae bacterium]|nr:ATP-binding cassette domain-containing protein [Spirochaetales bacterium]
MVQVKGLTKSFTTKKISKKVLDAITFEAFDSQVFGLLGPNGAGKTTTLRTIATLLKPDVGTVSVDGYDVVSHGTEVRNRIGFLTGDMKLSGHLSCREMMQFFGALNHMEPKVLNKRIAELANQLGMEDFLDKQIAKLSAGMSQKTAIAVSILHDPHVIIFDEPTSNLDILAVKVVADFIKDSKEAGKCVILSTHVLSEAERLCDRIGIIHKGKLLCSGEKDLLLTDYKAANLEDLFFNLVSLQEVRNDA